MRTMFLVLASLVVAGTASSQEAVVPTPKDVAYLIEQAPDDRFKTREVTAFSFRVSYEADGVIHDVCYNCSDEDGNLGPYEAAGLYLTKTVAQDGVPRTEVFRAWTPFSFTPSADSCVRGDRVVWNLGDVHQEPGAKEWCLAGFQEAYRLLVSRAGS